MKKKLIIIASILLGIAALSIGALYYIGDRMINEVIDMDLGKANVQPVQENSGNLANAAVPKVEDAVREDVPKGDVKQEDTNQMTSPAQETTKQTVPKPEAAKQNTPKQDTPKQVVPGRDATVQQAPVLLTPEKINEIKDSVGAKDKMEVAAMALKKFSASEINELKKIPIGGITNEEKQKLKELLYSRFTKEEIAKIMEMYKKYKN